MAYSPPVKAINTAQVGVNYHLALGTSSATGAANDRIYGYNLVPDSKLGILRQQTDLSAKNKMVSYSSELLIDRDFVNWPRVTDGDFSGGALQQVYLDTTRFWDSDLDVRVPGQVFLSPAWQRTATLVGSLGAVTPQCVAWNGSIYVTFGGASIYKQDGTTTVASGITNKFLATDGYYLFTADGVNNIRFTQNGTTWNGLTAASGALNQLWVVNQGTSGRFIYWTSTSGVNVSTLNKSDNGTFSAAVVPTGSTNFVILDLCSYLAGAAILSYDATGAAGFDLWYHDGANMTRIIRVDGYQPAGIVNALGQLYVTANDAAGTGIPVLIRIGAGAFDIVARTSVPLVGASITNAQIGAPVGSHHYVYFPVVSPQVTGISAQSYIGAYDILNGAYWHLPNLDGTDAPGVGIRGMAVSGRAPVFPMVASGNGALQYTVNTAKLAVSGSPAPKYQAAGWLVSSRIDFNTPGISKMFRRIVVHHAALTTGQSIKVNGYVDSEPISFTTGLSPTATATGSTVGQNTTVLTFPQATQGHSMYFAIQLNGGGTNNNQTTPIFYYASVEVSTPFSWEFSVDCTSKRQMLTQQPDNQGLKGRDLMYLLRNAWELGQAVTLYLNESGTVESFPCTIERIEFFNPSPQSGQATPLRPEDFESWMSLVLRQSSEP